MRLPWSLGRVTKTAMAEIEEMGSVVEKKDYTGSIVTQY